MNKIFIDANVLLDVLLPARREHYKALKVYELVCDRFDVIGTSENILTTIHYIATKNKTDCKKIYAFFESVVDSLEIFGFETILKDALMFYGDECKKGKNIDFEDLLQIMIAKKQNYKTFLTNDKDIINDENINIVGYDDILA